MESTPLTSSDLFEFSIDQAAADYLKDAARWAKFLAIVGFIFCGLFVIFSFTASALFAVMLPLYGQTWLFSIVFIIAALLQFFPCLFLYRFASKAQVAVRGQDPVALTQSFKNMRALYRFVGILMIIWLGFYVLIIIGSGIGGMLRR